MDEHSTSREFLLELYGAAVRSARPHACLPPHLPPPPSGRLVVFAVGKAASAMAAVTEAHYRAHAPRLGISGLALTRHGHSMPAQGESAIETIEAGHPVPDEAGLAASRRFLAMAHALGPDDLALVLLSGGGSALATLPAKGVSLADKQALTRALLASGAPIADINCVRKHLSRIKGGRLAAALAPASSLTLAISDVAGDEPSVIASGPTVPDPTTREDALAILERFAIPLPAHVRAALCAAPESPKPGDPCFSHARYELVASGAGALDAAARLAALRGYEILSLGDRIEGEARDLAAAHAAMALDAQKTGRRCVILSGGEAGVTFTPGKSGGRGGPNQEYALALALALAGTPGIAAIAGDTDGIDGGSGRADDPAGALAFPGTLSRARALGLDPEEALASHDSGSFFAALGDLVLTGPSFTNVNDFRAIVIDNACPTRSKAT